MECVYASDVSFSLWEQFCFGMEEDRDVITFVALKNIVNSASVHSLLDNRIWWDIESFDKNWLNLRSRLVSQEEQLIFHTGICS